MLHRRPQSLLLALALLAAPAVLAADALVLRLGTVALGDWQAQRVSLRLALKVAGRSAAELHIGSLRGPRVALSELRLRCPELKLRGPRWDCPSGTLLLPTGRELALSFSYAPEPRSLKLDLPEFALAQGQAGLRLHWQPGDWQLSLQGRGLGLQALHELAAGYLPGAAPAIAVQGQVALQAELRGSGQELTGGRLAASVRDLGLEAREGRLAGDQVAGELQLQLQRKAGALRVDGELNLTAGQAYLDPVFLDFSQHPLSFTAAGALRNGSLALEQFFLDHSEVLLARGSVAAELAPLRLERLALDVVEAQLPAAYRNYLRPFLIGTPLDALETSGAFSGEFRYASGALQRLELQLRDVHLDDTNEQFALYGVEGDLHWQADGEPVVSRLTWSGGYAYRVPLGAAELGLRAAGRSLELLDPVRLPVLDGALQINTLRLRNAGTETLALVFDADLAPVSLRGLTEALGWPALSGTVSGSLPMLAIEDGQLTLGGELRARVFDGSVRIGELRLSDPFGALPQLTADVEMRGLDLARITEAFSFGLITGQLNADIEDLRLIDWEPAAFNARFYTPVDDPTRHRISQRAIENISSLGGGGAAAALSRGFLSLFETFAYSRIGLSCQLRGNVCLMRGLAPAPGGGYYIIRGKGLPRIDVVGYAHAVSWPTLIEQLQAATAGEGPVVER